MSEASTYKAILAQEPPESQLIMPLSHHTHHQSSPSLTMSSLTISDPVLPKDSTIVVSGANGFIASHIVDQLLAAGYRVRGTVRDAAKYSWLSNHFEKTYGLGRFTLHAVPEVTKNGAFDEVLKGSPRRLACRRVKSTNTQTQVLTAQSTQSQSRT